MIKDILLRSLKIEISGGEYKANGTNNQDNCFYDIHNSFRSIILVVFQDSKKIV